MLKIRLWTCSVFLIYFSSLGNVQFSRAGTSSSVSGTVVDEQGIAIPEARVELYRTSSAAASPPVLTSMTGSFLVFPVDFGHYILKVQSSGYKTFSVEVDVSSGAATAVTCRLLKEGNTNETGHEMVLNVKAKRHLVQSAAPESSVEVDNDRIQTLPQANQIKLPKLLSETSPGVVAGAFGQSFIRGNHANIQYQIDGVQLPDSPSNTFGEAFSPRNIDHMEVITGGIPAEYGERLSAVVNIISKTGAEEPGGSAEINYGSYNTFSPEATYGGSNKDGDFHYYLSANYMSTERGLDTPQPSSVSNQDQGGTDAVHDKSNGNNEFAKLDWVYDNSNKFTFVFFDSRTFFQIPNYPASFSYGMPFFGPNFRDPWGDGPFIYTPPNTNDTQLETDDYAILSWKHSFSETAFLRIAPYVKTSYIRFQNDPANDLSANAPASFAENRNVVNYGMSADYTNRLNDQHKLKTGLQAQASRATGNFIVTTKASPGTPYEDSLPTNGLLAAVYAQDDYTISEKWSLSGGLRFSALEATLEGTTPPLESAWQPRLGVNFLANENTKLHAYYGRLFQPAPLENLRDAFSTVGGGTAAPYNILPETDNYFEVGMAQQFAGNQVAMLNVYYKQATNMLDDTQLLNSAISQPYNFATGFATGAELSVKGEITDYLSEYFNYSFEIAKGKGISGGVFAFDPTTLPPNTYQYLDHVQIHTLNTGWTYKRGQYFGTVAALFGSGLRAGPGNSVSLPSHLSFDLTGGYEFKSQSWWGKVKVSADILNLTNNIYPISVANGFNGSHYAAGREYFIHLVKEL